MAAATAIPFDEARELARLNARMRWYRVERFIEHVQVDSATYIEGLALLAQAWDRRFWPRYRRVVSFVAGVELPRHELDEALAGIAAWHRANARYEITEAGRRRALAEPEGV